ncbi:MAG: TRAP transporter small permease [Chloroflexota bacterium]
MNTVRTVGTVAVRWFDRLTDAAYYATLGFLLFLALSIGLNVFMRRVLDQPFGWVIQGGQYTLVYITFFASTRLLRQGAHTRMTLLSERLGPLPAAWLSLSANVVALAICGVLTWETGSSTVGSFADGATYRGNFDIAQWVIWWVMPVGFGFLGLEFIRHLGRDVAELRRLRAHPHQGSGERDADGHRPGEQGHL